MTTSTTRNFAGLFFDKGVAVNNVKHPDFGAKGDGTTPDTIAIGRAIAAGGTVFFPPGAYIIDAPLTISANNTVLVGCGHASQLRFTPTGGGTMLLFEGSDLQNAGLRDLHLRSRSDDAGGLKVAVDCHGVRDFRMENVEIGEPGNPWSGSGTGSTGLKVRGGQSSSFEDLTITADVPISIDIDSLDTKDLQDCTFRNLNLTSSTPPNPVIIVQPGAILRSVTFGGFQAFVQGGLYWVDGATVPRGLTTDDRKSHNVILENIRAEQIGDNAGTYAVQIEKNSAGPLYELTLRNCLLAPWAAGWSGLRTDNVYRTVANQVRYEGGGLTANAYSISGGEIVNGLTAGEITGLQLSWTSATQITIAPGRCRSDDNMFDIVVPSSPIFKVDITQSGPATQDNLYTGGRESGTLKTLNTWYAVWLIGKNRDSAVPPQSGLLSLSGTTPTMPSNYQVKRLIGWIRTDASENIIKFWQSSDGRTRRHVLDVRSISLPDGAATTYTNVDVSAGVPPGCKLAVVNAALSTASATDRVFLRPNGSSTTDPPWQFGPGVNTGTGNKAVYGPIEMPVDSGRIVQYKVSSASDRADLWVDGFDLEV